MREKFIITIDKDTKKMKLEEFGELIKEEFSLLAVNEYPDIITDELAKGKEAFINALRNVKIFPPYDIANSIADAVILMIETETYVKEVLLDDKDYIQKSEDEESEEEKGFDRLDNDKEFIDIIDEDIDRENIDESVDIDDLLQDGENINVSSGIKIAEDEIEKSSSSEEDVL